MRKNYVKKLVLGCITLSVLIVAIGMSYALFSEVLVGQKQYTLESGALRIYLDESQTSNSISLTDAIPVSDDEGMNNASYKFSLINQEDEELAYTIYLREEEFENKTPTSAIRYYYSRDVGDIEVVRNIEENVTEAGDFYLESDVIPGETTYNYEFKMWINYEAGNEILNTQYSIHLEIEAKQTIAIYKDVVLNGTDPVLSDNLVPILISDDGTVTKASLYKEWYNYTEKEWANAVILVDDTVRYSVGDTIPESNIESYFVWIPRYRYKIFDEGNYTELTELDDTAVQVIEVEFENKEVEASTGTVKDSWLTHPAFTTFDSNGFWVGKFETGYNGATTTATAQVNSSDYSKIIIKPNKYSWRNITVGNMFKASYDYMRNEDSHMMKNTEWGAVAYLQHSNYGSRASVRVNNNSAFITGYAAVVEPTLAFSPTSISGNQYGTATSVTLPYNTTTGYTASTTGNISGVYDMSGGAYEYVMGYNTKASAVGGSSGLTGIYGDFFTSLDWEKYYDRYTTTATTVYTSYNTRILGDATGEMGSFRSVTDPDGVARYRSSWYNDHAYFVIPDYPWFYRGDHYSHGVGSGIFAFRYNTGDVSTALSFRVVLTP